MPVGPAPVGAQELLEIAPRLAPDVQTRRIESGGRPLWVLRNPATGRYFQASPRLYLLISTLDGSIKIKDALAQLPPAVAGPQERLGALLDGVGGMISAGLLILPGVRPMPKRPSATLVGASRLVFTRVRLGDMGPAVPVFDALLGWLYSRSGAVILALLLAAVAVAWAGRGPDLAEQMDRLARIGLADVAVGYLLFVPAKLLHEAGHIVAARRMAAAEGFVERTHPWGVSFMFLMPAPYVDASSAWFLRNPRRRAVVGLAGVATDLLVASLAALLWASLGPGTLRDRAFDLVAICGASSLLFNLNPLVRLDGYYVLSDLIGVPNLLGTAQEALVRTVFGPFGLAPLPRAADVGLGLYAAASWLYRWTIYLWVFWMAGGLHWLLAGGVAAVIALLFLGMPFVRLALAARSAFFRAPARTALAISAGAGLVAAAVFLPLPQHVVVEGVVVRHGLRFVFSRTDGQVLHVAGAGRGGRDPVLRLENPDTERMLIQLHAEAHALAIEARSARAAGAERIDALAERQRSIADQIAALEAERATWEVRAPADAWWEPVRAEGLANAWVRRDDTRPLGALVADGPTEIRLVLDQWDGPAAISALTADPDVRIPMRLRGMGAAQFTAHPVWPVTEARDALPSPALAEGMGGRIPAKLDDMGLARPSERVFELRVVPVGEALPTLRHGTRVEARIALAPVPLFDQIWRRTRQTLQRRLAV